MHKQNLVLTKCFLCQYFHRVNHKMCYLYMPSPRRTGCYIRGMSSLDPNSQYIHSSFNLYF